MNVTHIPLRATTGAYILNSGLSKLNASPEASMHMHGFAATAYPSVTAMVPATKFAKVLGGAEVALGAALLLPKFPSAIAGTALTGFGVALLGLYAKAPGLREPGGIRPTEDGTAIAKDVWLVGAGATLAWQGFANGAKRAGKRAAKAITEAADNTQSALSNAAESAQSAVSRN